MASQASGQERRDRWSWKYDWQRKEAAILRDDYGPGDEEWEDDHDINLKLYGYVEDEKQEDWCLCRHCEKRLESKRYWIRVEQELERQAEQAWFLFLYDLGNPIACLLGILRGSK